MLCSKSLCFPVLEAFQANGELYSYWQPLFPTPLCRLFPWSSSFALRPQKTNVFCIDFMPFLVHESYSHYVVQS